MKQILLRSVAGNEKSSRNNVHQNKHQKGSMRFFVVPILIALSLSFSAIFSQHESHPIEVGIAWVGKASMPDRVLNGVREIIAKKAPHIQFEVHRELPDIATLDSIIGYFEKNKSAMVIMGSNGTELLGRRGAAIPAFIGGTSNPVELGAAISLDKPNHNISGVTYSLPLLLKLEAFRQIYPGLQSFILLVESGQPGSRFEEKQTHIAAAQMGLDSRTIYCHSIEDAIAAVQQAPKDAAIILGLQPLLIDNASEIVKQAENRMVFSYSEQVVEKGSLAALVPDDHKLGQMLGQMLVDHLVNGKSMDNMPILVDTEPKLRLNYNALQRVWERIPLAIRSLARSEQMLESILGSASAGIYKIENRTIVYANDYILNLTGYTRDELIGKQGTILYFSKEEYERLEKETLNQLAKKTTASGEFTWKHKDGSIRNMLLSTSAHQPVEFTGAFTINALDITDKKKTEAKMANRTNLFFTGMAIFVIVLAMLVLRLLTTLRLRKSAMKALHKSEAQFKSLFTNAADAMFIIDITTGIIIDANGAAQKLIQKPLSEIIGLHQTSLHPPQENYLYKEFFENHIQELESSDVTTALEKNVMSANGTLVPVEIVTSKVNYQAIECMMGTFRDITERKIAEKERQQKEILEKKVEIAEISLRFKQNFLANMSHEIRTPLTGIMGMIDILEQTHLNEQQQDYVQTLKLSGHNLKEIIDQVLDYSKIEAGKITLRPSVFQFACLHHETEMLYRNNLKKGVTRTSIIDTGVPHYIEADKYRISQILNNLVSNAIKFTSKGSITIHSSLVSQNLPARQVVIKTEVSDSGIGIPEELQQKLFTPFFQIGSIDTRNYDGTGLGLSICKQLAELMGGQIGVNSKKGTGSTFWFTYTAIIAEEPKAPPPQTVNSFTPVKLKILLAEDKIVNQKVVKLILNAMGHEVHVASNGQEAIQLYRPGRFDLILMDIQMPVMNGVTAMQILKEKYDNLPPIVGLSANAFEGDREKYMTLGMDEYLTKPVKKEDFEGLIRRLIL